MFSSGEKPKDVGEAEAEDSHLSSYQQQILAREIGYPRPPSLSEGGAWLIHG